MVVAVVFGLSTSLFAQGEANVTQSIDPKELEKAQKAFVEKLGSQTTKFEVKEIKEGFVFNNRYDHVTLLVLWEKNCKSCIKQIPNLNRYFLDLRGKLDIIAVELSGMTTPQLQAFAKEHKVLYTLISGVENKQFVAAAMHKFRFGKDENGKDKKEGLPFMVVMGYTGHTHAIIRGVPNDPAEMETFLLKIVQYYENQKNADKNTTKETE
jgi:thiol-disulfide isomerase/thioredoxin